MMDSHTRMFFATVNGRVYGVRCVYSPTFFGKGAWATGPDATMKWHIQVAEYGVDQSISMNTLQGPYGKQVGYEFDTLQEAMGAALWKIMLSQDAERKDKTHATSENTDDQPVLAEEPARSKLPATDH